MNETVAVIGLGTMGLGIAQVYAQAGYRVLATDAVVGARDTAVARLSAGLAPRVAAGKMPADVAQAIAGRLQVVDTIAGLDGAALVIEAVAEDLHIKQALFAEVERGLSGQPVLATNTSSLSVRAIRDGLARPDHVLGLHFFNPAPVMKLVELVVPARTDRAAAALARSLTEAAGKVVVDAPDSPGFIVNRCARPYYGEALALMAEGRTAGEIDAAMQAAGYRIGPFALIDLIGADINLAATRGLYQAMGAHPRYHVFPALEQAVAAGRLGRKSGSGFVTGTDTPAPPEDATTIALRIEAMLVNEACWLVQESGTSEEAIDTALKLGLNFPRGPFQMLAAHGAEAIRVTLVLLHAAAPPAMKDRYAPAPYLETRP
ncbi:MAG: 3-hydroxyacyl-CoA dehydrogenase NAD-binding domain-containing protein [Paracoccaceae bacterium]